MFLLSEVQVDRIISNRRVNILVGLAITAVVFALPRGWGIGIFTGFMLFGLGVYGVAFQTWRTNPGLWMLAVLLLVTLGPFYACIEYLYLQRILSPPAANQARQPFTWDQLRWSVDATLAVPLLAKQVRLAATVAIKNWKLTRIVNRTIR